jgi:hypothetical protein
MTPDVAHGDWRGAPGACAAVGWRCRSPSGHDSTCGRRLSMIQHGLALVLVANEAEAGFELGGRSVVRLKISWLELLIVVLGRLEIGSALGWEGRAGKCR